MDYNQWQRHLALYIKQHPQQNAVQDWSQPMEYWAGSQQANNLQNYQADTYKNFLAQLTPEQRAEYQRVTDQNYAKGEKGHRLAFGASLAAMGGLGALGAAGSGGAAAGGSSGLMGATDAILAAPYPGALGASSLGGAGMFSGDLASYFPAGLGGAESGGLGSLATGSGSLGGLGSLGSAVGNGLDGIGGAGGALGNGSGATIPTDGSGSFNWGDLLKQVGGSSGLLNLLGNLGIGYLGSSAANHASQAQIDAANQANALAKYIYDQSRADQAPYREAGTTALAGIQSLLKDPSSITSMPDYQFGLNEGTKQLNNSAASRGMVYSGQQGKALQRYGQDYAGSKLDASYNRLANIAGIGQVATNQSNALGQNYAANVGDTLQGAGNARGAGYIGSANAWGQGIGGALNGFNQQSLIDMLLKKAGG